MAVSGDFLTGDDLDDLFSLIDGGFLDGDDSLNKHIDDIATEIASNENNIASFKCSQCEKVCKSQRGLTRHTNVKHAPATSSPSSLPDDGSINLTPQALTRLEISMKKLHPILLMNIVKKCAVNVSNDLCFPLSMRVKFSTEQFIFLHADAESLWYKFRAVIDSYCGDAEKFYAKFYALFLDNLLPTKFDDKILTNTLLSEVANEVLVHLSGCMAIKETVVKVANIPEKELKSLQYLAGFVIHKLYSKFYFSKISSSAFNEQCCLILHACKVETDDTQTLVNARDRGGLWKVSKRMQDICLECEIVFRNKTANFTSSLVCEDLVKETMNNILVISNFNAIAQSVDTPVKKEFRMNLLEHILTLYIRVRSFSFAKDVREKHKAAKKASRKRSLRTEINRASSSTVEGH